MKSTRFAIIVIAAVQCIGAQLVRAQDPPDSPTPTPTPDEVPFAPPPGMWRPSVGDMMSHMLSLNDAQKAQLQTYFDNAQPRLNAIHQEARQAEGEVMKQLLVNIRPLLTPEQQSKADALQQMHGPPPPPPVAAN